jgi:hypothetical protein
MKVMSDSFEDFDELLGVGLVGVVDWAGYFEYIFDF